MAVSLSAHSTVGLVNNTSETLSFKVSLVSWSEARAHTVLLTHHLLQFDGILEGAGQDTVYVTCANEVAESLLAGYNGTIFCYGQVGRTKSQSMPSCPS